MTPTSSSAPRLASWARTVVALALLLTSCGGRTPPPFIDPGASADPVAVEYWASCDVRCSVEIVTARGHVVESVVERWSKAIRIARGTPVSMTVTPGSQRDIVTFARIRVDGDIAADARRQTFVRGEPVYVAAFTDRAGQRPGRR